MLFRSCPQQGLDPAENAAKGEFKFNNSKLHLRAIIIAVNLLLFEQRNCPQVACQANAALNPHLLRITRRLQCVLSPLLLSMVSRLFGFSCFHFPKQASGLAGSGYFLASISEWLAYRYHLPIVFPTGNYTKCKRFVHTLFQNRCS